MFLFVYCQRECARIFARNGGIVLTLKHYDDRYELIGFDCTPFSANPEKETLFFGGETVMKIDGIQQRVNAKWEKYDEWLEAVHAVFRLMNGLTLKGRKIMTDESDQKRMTQLLNLIDHNQGSKDYDNFLPEYIRNLITFQYQSTDDINLLFGEYINEYRWLHDVFPSPLDIIASSNRSALNFIVPNIDAENANRCERIGLVNNYQQLQEWLASLKRDVDAKCGNTIREDYYQI